MSETEAEKQERIKQETKELLDRLARENQEKLNRGEK